MKGLFVCCLSALAMLAGASSGQASHLDGPGTASLGLDARASFKRCSSSMPFYNLRTKRVSCRLARRVTKRLWANGFKQGRVLGFRCKRVGSYGPPTRGGGSYWRCAKGSRLVRFTVGS